VATNRLPAASRKPHNSSIINLEIGVRSQAACGSTLTFGSNLATIMLPPQPNPEFYQFDFFETVVHGGPVILSLFGIMVAISVAALISIFLPMQRLRHSQLQDIRMLPALIGLIMTAYCLYILMPVTLETYDFKARNVLPGILEAFGFTLLGSSSSAVVIFASIVYSIVNPSKPNKAVEGNLAR